MKAFYTIWFLLASSAILVAPSQLSSPTWSTSCRFKHYRGRYAQIGATDHSPPTLQGVASAVQCEERCGEDPECGLYIWYERGCVNSQQSVRLWLEVGVVDGSLFDIFTLDSYVSGSRDCDADDVTGSGGGVRCSYQRNELMPNAMVPLDALLWIRVEDFPFPTPRPSITAAACQSMCSYYTECKSVAHAVRGQDEHESGVSSLCGLLPTSLLAQDNLHLYNYTGNLMSHYHAIYSYYDKICQ